MGAGASAGEGRIFCHHCGARTACREFDQDGHIRCAACGATDNVVATDSRLPVTSLLPNSQSGGSSSSSAAVLRTGGDSPDVHESAVAQEASPGAPSGPLRVESVTIVAVQRPEDGGLLLRILPNLVPRRQTGTGSPGGTSSVDGIDREVADAPEDDFDRDDQVRTPDGEDADMPPEPACEALISRLESSPLSMAGPAAAESGFCVICADDFAEEGALVAELSCGHAFHDDCIRIWLKRRHTCPTCRMELEVDDVRYLRSIGLADEANALEKVQKESNEQKQRQQAAARQRWVGPMRRGEPVHFGLKCGNCGVTPLVGECHSCQSCEGYILCAACLAHREGLRPKSEQSIGDVARCPKLVENHPDDHEFKPFRAGGALAGGVPTGPGGLLTIFVPAPADAVRSGGGEGSQSGSATPEPAGEAVNIAASEVAFAAVRSLAIAPLGEISTSIGLSRWTPTQSQRR